MSTPMGFREAKTTAPKDEGAEGSTPTMPQSQQSTENLARLLRKGLGVGNFCPYAGDPLEDSGNEPGVGMSADQIASNDALLARLTQVEKNTEGWRRFMIGTSVVLFATLVALFSLQSMWTQFAINSLSDTQVQALEENRREIDRSIQENRRETDRLAAELRRSQQAAYEDLQKNQDRHFEQLRTMLATPRPQR